MIHYKKYKLGPFTSSEIEIRDIIKGWGAISIAFGILLGGGLHFNAEFLSSLLLAAFTVGIGFLFHELGHKVVAQRYGLWAEFRSFDQMLILAIIMSFFGFVLAAPGAVMISGNNVDIKKNGRISVAGPLVNIIIALAFLGLHYAIPSRMTTIGFMVNSWLALFNLLPFGNFDGKKVFVYSKKIWGSMAVVSAVLVFSAGYLFTL